MTRRPLPAALGPGFTTSQALAAGVGRRRLAADDLHRPAHGVRTLAEPADLLEKARALSLVLPEGSVLSHWTAARLLGLWLPHRWTPAEPLDVMLAKGDGRVRRPGVRCHPVVSPRSVVRSHGLRVTSPVDTWADLACELPVDDLVVLGDSVVRFRGELARPEDLDAVLPRIRRGARTARTARGLVRPGSASPMETVVRLLLLRAGLPEPELNAVIRSSTGAYLGAFDLVWRARRVVVEYDGDQHRTDREQWLRDHDRIRSLADEGWTVIVLRASDLRRDRRAATVERVRAALRD